MRGRPEPSRPATAQPAGPAAGVPAPWALPPEDVLRGLGVSAERGLTAEEASRRLAEIGRNELPAERGTSVATLVVRQFRSALVYILLVAAVITIAIGDYVDAAVIGAVLVLNAVIGFVQEYRAEQSMEALLQLARARARVLRGGREREIDAAELVPGDVVLLEAGTKVPADCRLVHAAALVADESLLTGESLPVAKITRAVRPEAPLADRTNSLFMATVVTRGHGRAVVIATGPRAELGQIASSVHQIGERETPLQRRMTQLARIVAVAVLVLAGVGLALGAVAGEDIDQLFLTVVALAVSAIPEGLPVVLTITLAISVRRMAAQHAIVRRLSAVETLGSCTAIGSDKTGTLTENRMTVQRIVTPDGHEHAVTGIGYETAGTIMDGETPVVPHEGSALHASLLTGALCSDAAAVPENGTFDVRGDPTEVALVVAAAKAGMFKDELEERLPRVAQVPFDPQLRYSATFNDTGGRHLRVFVLGAPEEILPLCELAYGGERLAHEQMLAEAHRLAAQGLRVLATAVGEASRDVAGDDRSLPLPPLAFSGLVGMIDPPREEAKEAIRGCREAGIRVLMITGDHAATGLAIGRVLGIAEPGSGVVTGAELERLDDDELDALLARTAVFARVSPEHKHRIVRALQRRGETVAVTGDGVNDAPALRAADIGAAMGRSGTDVAKEAADMVVSDDNFATIYAAVEEGRIAFDNVRKTTFYLVSSGVGEVLTVLASLAFRFQLPFLPAQLLWINLVTNGVQDVALAFEPGEKELKRRPPRPREEGVISRLLWERTVIAGAVMAVGTIGLFLLELDKGIEYARSVAVTTMVLFQIFHVGNSRSEYLSAFRKSPFSNRFLFFGTAAVLGIQIAALHLPFTQYVFRLEPLGLGTWLEITAVASSIIVAVELHKLVRDPSGWKGERRTSAPGSGAAR